jgi:predicted DNA-binding transcriptional regulator YafY
MRFDPATRLLRLVQLLSAPRTGVSVEQMAAELNVGRRTVERLREQIGYTIAIKVSCHLLRQIGLDSLPEMYGGMRWVFR